jgi:hypothetical protein
MKTNALEGFFINNLIGESSQNKINKGASDNILPKRPLHFEKAVQRITIEPQTISLSAFPAEQKPVFSKSLKRSIK